MFFTMLIHPCTELFLAHMGTLGHFGQGITVVGAPSSTHLKLILSIKIEFEIQNAVNTIDSDDLDLKPLDPIFCNNSS